MDEVLLHDGGPLYTETNLHSFIVEPFNATSAALFILIALYWFFKLRGRYTRFPMLSSATILLAIGAIGGTIYHGFRFHGFFMYMDWLPILAICILASSYFLLRLSRSYIKAFFWLAGAISFQFLNFSAVPDWLSTNLSYTVLGLAILVPIAFVQMRTRFKYWGLIIAALIAFGFALFFRISDRFQWIPIGTHFLWHVFGAVACHIMFIYMYKFKRRFPRFELISRISLKRLSRAKA